MYGYSLGISRLYSSGVSVDTDAQAFITAASITDSTQKSAINQLVIDLKNDNIWTKLKAVYPFVGQSATSTKFNLKDPQDTDAAFRITWNGGITYTNGVLSNGTNGYGNTHFIPSINSTNNSTSLGYKSTTNAGGSYAEFGAFSTGRFAIYNFSGAESANQYNSSAGDGAITATQTDTSGFYIASRTASNSFKLFRNAVQLGSTATGAGGSVSGIAIELYIGALNNAGSAALFTPRNLTFAFTGDGLSDTDVSNLTTAINTLDTTLGR
jgi:hypothetical protein